MMNSCYNKGRKRVSFEDLINQGLKELAGIQEEVLNPKVNIYEDENSFNVELLAPGLKKDDFDIQASKDVLTIAHKKKEDEKQDDKKYLKRSFRINSFKRSFQLPEQANSEQIHANYEDGILYIQIEKAEETKPTVHNIQVA